MSILDTRAARVLVTIFCLVLCLAFIYFARQTLVVFCSRSFLLICSRRPSNILNAGIRDHIEEATRSSPPTSCCLVPSRSWQRQSARASSLKAQHLSQQLPELSERVSSGQLVSQVGTRRGWSVETQQRIQSLFLDHRTHIVTLL
jgi:hypothetical protein